MAISDGVFPDAMKVAKMIPVSKGRDMKELSNYRPISVLSQFSKLFERVLNSRLSSFLQKCDITECQYGFRKGKRR